MFVEGLTVARTVACAIQCAAASLFIVASHTIRLDETETTALQVSYETQSVFTLHEPVVIEFNVENTGTEVAAFDLGLRRTSAFLLDIQRPDASRVRALPPTSGGVVRKGAITLEAGQRYRQRLLLNEWAEFLQVGLYKVTVVLTAPFNTRTGQTIDVPRAADVAFRIAARDEAALDATCRRLAAAVASQSIADQIEGVTALSEVRDPIAVPYLRQVLAVTDGFDSMVLSALAKIDGDAAVAALMEAAESENRDRSEMAHNVLKRRAKE